MMNVGVLCGVCGVVSVCGGGASDVGGVERGAVAAV